MLWIFIRGTIQLQRHGNGTRRTASARRPISLYYRLGLCTLDKLDNSRRRDLEHQILDLIISEGKLEPSRVTSEATLESLDVHSIDIVMLMLAIEDKFGVYIPIDGKIAEAKDVGSFVHSVADHLLGGQ